jgi:hypothetical protein
VRHKTANMNSQVSRLRFSETSDEFWRSSRGEEWPKHTSSHFGAVLVSRYRPDKLNISSVCWT